MYNSISGIYAGLHIQGTQTFVLLNQDGLEWAIETSKSTLAALPQRGERLRLLVWLHHIEDGMSLYGFLHEEERQVFFQLLKVQGIGPRGAMRILSGTSPQNLLRLLETEDLAGLEKIPGLGKKTSQKVLLTLRGKLVFNDQSSAEGAPSPDDDIISALAEMGFDRKDATREIQKIAPELADKSRTEREQELLRRAIIALS
jgi:Holliday junction DNA helicase RuvA